jgi:hypothetical protein
MSIEMDEQIKRWTAAVLIQAYTLGKIVDDVAKTKMSSQDWDNLINDVVLEGMLTPSECETSSRRRHIRRDSKG